MSVTKQLVEFLEFFAIGLLLAIIFDFFRAYRKFKTPSNRDIIFQDILYFVIATVIVVLGVVSILNSNFRLYVIIAIILGVLIHTYFFSKYSIKFFIVFFKTSESIFGFLNITLSLFKQILIKILNLFKKIAKKCCKKFFYVINFGKYKGKILHKKKFKQKKKSKKEVNGYETKKV